MTTPDILSPMVLGTMTFGDTVDTDGAGALLDVALDAGITHIDTANGYAARCGRAHPVDVTGRQA